MLNEAADADAQAFPMRGIPQPTREQALTLPQVYISRHPVVAHKMTLLRDRHTTPRDFYRLVCDLGALLAYEATSDLRLATSDRRTHADCDAEPRDRQKRK